MDRIKNDIPSSRYCTILVLFTKQTDIHCNCVTLSLLMNMHQFITLKHYFFLKSPCLIQPSAKTSHSAVVVAQTIGTTVSAEIQLLTGSTYALVLK